MSKERVYIDTSAYLAILLGEKAATPIKKFISHKILCSSILLVLEAERNLVRLSRQKLLKPDQHEKCLLQLKKDCELFLLKEVTMDLCLNSQFPPLQTPRSNDLIHLRSAFWFQNNGGISGFVTLDEDQKKAAVDFGLNTFQNTF